jgi:glycine dehydrogenase
LKRIGCTIGREPFFDTLRVFRPDRSVQEIVNRARQHRINLGPANGRSITLALDETTSIADVEELLELFHDGRPVEFTVEELASDDVEFEPPFRRTSSFLTHPVFNRYHSETEMLRYLRKLESRDLSLTHSMIPLGSCTMKLNATSEMFPVSWPEFSKLHPLAPVEQAADIKFCSSNWRNGSLKSLGLPASLQPNAGSQGEFAGLIAIRNFHATRGQARNICLIPTSAHGTNSGQRRDGGFKGCRGGL